MSLKFLPIPCVVRASILYNGSQYTVGPVVRACIVSVPSQHVMSSRGAPIIGISRLSAVLPIIGIGR